MTMTFLAQTGPETVHTLVFNGGGPLWVQALVWLAGLAVIAMTVANHRRLQPRRRRLGMISLRAILVVLLVVLFYQPALLEERVATHRNTVVVLSDVSTSMDLPHADGTSRRAAVERWFEEERDALSARIADKSDLGFYAFAEGTSEVRDPRAEDTRRPAGGGTDFLGAFREIRAQLRNRDLAGVIVLTDGIDSTAEGRRSEPGAELVRAIKDLKAPVTFVGVSDAANVKDVAISQLSSNNFAFLLNASSLEAVVETHGFPGAQLPVRLFENGAEVATELVSVAPGERYHRVRFEFVPKKLGKQVYSVAVDVQPDEVWSRNNRKSTIINIVRDKIRVVQIEGQPSWDQRHLRNLLKENPNVDLVSFFILVNRFNYRPLSSNETSLIPFPARELFEEELGGFDLLVFQNFNYGPFQTREYLPNIARFVRDGGAFLMVGGPLSLSAGDYYGTEIVDVLPVDIPPGWGQAPTTDTEPFAPQLTESGRHHPVTRLVLDPSQNRSVWRDLPALEGMNLATGLKKGAVTLVEHPTLTTPSGAKQPVVAVTEAGKGRSMVVATDSTWHWAFKGDAAGADRQDAHAYARFWENAIRWLIRDPELDLLKVRALRESVPVGESAELLLTAFLPDYRPAAGQRLEVVVTRRSETDAAGGGERIAEIKELTTDAQGEARWRVDVAAPGVYEVTASADFGEGRRATALDLFVGTDANPEMERIVADARFTQAIAELSGGKVLEPGGTASEIPLLEPTVMRVRNRAHVELWSSSWMLALLASLFALEWWLRRRYGYL